MICYPSSAASKMDDDEIDNKETINRILETLDPWTLRVSLLELNLMFKQAKNNAVSDCFIECFFMPPFKEEGVYCFAIVCRSVD